LSIVPGLPDFGGCAVAEAGVGAVVVGLDVGGGLGSGLVEGLELGASDESLLEFPEPALDERLGFGVAVAAASVPDLELAELFAEAAGGERRAVVGG
jgi:hypothetical protein